MTPEGKVKQKWAKLAKKYGIKYTNLIVTGDKGDPDKVVWVAGGRPILAEFKGPSGRLSPNQKKKIAMYESLGYDVRVIRGSDEAEALAEEVRMKNGNVN